MSPAAKAAWRTLYARPDPVAARADLVDLGARLFRDTRLSGDGRRSCATCHRPDRGFTDGLPRALGPDGSAAVRNTPTLWNVGWSGALNWDGGRPTLETQIRGPITGRMELGGRLAAITARLNADRALVQAFQAVFADGPHIEDRHVIAALVAFERSLVSPRTRFDAWTDGDDSALSAEESKGFALFTGKGGCARCHSGWRFTDDRLHDIGLPVSGDATAFKTPTLRELRTTDPYMHNGSIATLEDAVRHYSERVIERPSLSPNLAPDLDLTDAEVRQLVAFLRALSSE